MKGIYETTLKSFQKDYLIREGKFHFPLKNKENNTTGYEIYEHNSLNFNLPEDVSKEPKYGIWHTHFHPDRAKTQKVFIFNRVIDALSYYQIYRPKVDFSQSTFISVGGKIGKDTLSILQTLYPLSIEAKYYCTFINNFNGLLYNFALEKSINPKFNFQLGRVGAHFECVVNGRFHQLDWTDLSFETLFIKLNVKPRLSFLQAKRGANFHEMLLNLQANNKSNGRMSSERQKM
jgi:hypothetical protein